MEELFRFMLARPAQRADDAGTVLVTPSAGYANHLREVRSAGHSRAVIIRLALAERNSQNSLKSTEALQNAGPLNALAAKLSNGADTSLQKLNELIKTTFDQTAKKVVTSEAFISDRQRLSDVLLTNAILSNDGPVASFEAARYLRLMALIVRVADGDSSLSAPGGIKEALGRTLVYPAGIFPLAPEGTAAAPMRGTLTEINENGESLRCRRDAVLATYTMLTRLAPEQLALSEAGSSLQPSHESPPRAAFPPAAEVTASEQAPLPEQAPSGAGGLSPEANRLRAAPLLVKSSVAAAFGEREKAVLAERGLDLTRVNLHYAIERLSAELQELDLQITRENSASPQQVIHMGSAFLPAETTVIGPITAGQFQPLPASIPSTHGNVAPAGIGDLLVVKQNLKKYEARELAHIENILKGEYKERLHSRARTTEETVTTEIELKKEEERDLQTTERFELKTETSQVQKEDTSFKLGLTVSGKYGPVVEFKATTDFALNQVKEEATKIASDYSKDVTARATSRIFERRREERILKTIEVFEEKNTHGFDNKAGADHVVGQYQWIDKVYEAQVFNYGKRLLFDIMLPEPAAFLIYAAGEQPKAGADLVKPIPFTLTPTDISEWNYAYYVKLYQVVGVTPPPAPYITVSKAVEGKGKNDDGATKTMEIPLPDGYQAISGSVSISFNRWEPGRVDVMLDRLWNRLDNGVWNFTLNNNVGSVALSMKTHKVEAFAASVEITCQRTQRALDEWKLKTHDAILQAYQKQLRDYEEKLAALEVQAAQQIQGRNPLENQHLIRAELKKGAISVFTAQHYDLFGSIALSPQGYPQPNLPEAAVEGKYIRFFEQAFEWEQMMFFYYPYFWGRKSNWLKRALLQDVDPLFEEFLKAGAARVVVSVRPGFEQAIAHFLDTGEIWEGGDLPPITSPMYVSIIEEIRERDQAPGTEIPQGDPWEVRLPTTLVKVRAAASLPEWQKNDQGEWLPV